MAPLPVSADGNNSKVSVDQAASQAAGSGSEVSLDRFSGAPGETLSRARTRVSRNLGHWLTAAARKGDADELARLLKLGPDVNFRDTDGITPLQAACHVGMDG